MSTCSKAGVMLVAAAMALGGVARLDAQQQRLTSRSSMHITLPEDSPVALAGADWGESVVTPRGSAMLLDLHTAITFRNISQHRVRGITLLVMAQEVAPGGKASVSVPSLDVGPGEAFPVRIDLRLMRPQTQTEGSLVDISIDGVLFDSLEFYGPNKLNSRRSMTLWEMEARRDRKHMKSVYESAGADSLRRQLVDIQARLSDRPKLDVQVARGRTTAQEPERSVRVAFLRMPGQPVQPSDGFAGVTSTEARAPHVEVVNSSTRGVRYVELGWIVQNQSGEEFFAGSVPAEVNLAPGQRTKIQPEASVKLTERNGRPVPISEMTGFVNHVEFQDGTMWIPQRANMDSGRLRSVLNPSPEEQRLSDLYRRKGLQAVIDELRKY